MKAGIEYSAKAEDIHKQLQLEGYDETEKVIVASILTQISSNIMATKVTTTFLGEQGLLK